MEKYGEVGVTNIENPQILSLNPFARIAKRPCSFKSPEAYNEAVKDLENELYKIGKKMEGLIFVIIVVGIFFYILVVLPKKEKNSLPVTALSMLSACVRTGMLQRRFASALRNSIRSATA